MSLKAIIIQRETSAQSLISPSWLGNQHYVVELLWLRGFRHARPSRAPGLVSWCVLLASLLRWLFQFIASAMDFAVWKWIPRTKFLSGQTFRSSPCLPQVHVCFQIAIYKNKYISHSLSPLGSNQRLATFTQVQPGLLIIITFSKCHSVHDGTIFFCNVSFYDKQLCTTTMR